MNKFSCSDLLFIIFYLTLFVCDAERSKQAVDDVINLFSEVEVLFTKEKEDFKNIRHSFVETNCMTYFSLL
jgi:hypothetical protein